LRLAHPLLFHRPHDTRPQIITICFAHVPQSRIGLTTLQIALGRNQVRMADDPAVASLDYDHLEDDGEREGERETTWFGIIESLAAMMDARDHATNAHPHAVAALAMRLAVILGLPAGQTRIIGAAGRLHDIGKVAVPDAILSKPERLTAAEWVLMRRHPAVGAEIVNRVPMLRAVVPMIHGHHERWDGGATPTALQGRLFPSGRGSWRSQMRTVR